MDSRTRERRREEGGVVVEAGAEDEGVDEEADEAFELREAASGDGRADGDVTLARVAGEEELVGGQEGHEGSDALLLAQGGEGGGQLAGEADIDGAAAKSLDEGAGEVGGQLEGARSAQEVVAPPGELGVERIAMQPGALPGSVVGVLDGQCGEGRRQAGGEGGVEGGHLSDEEAHGPTIGDDVVHGQQQHVVPGGQSQQGGAHQRPVDEVERAGGFGERQAARFVLQLRVAGEVHQLELESRLDGDVL